MELWLPDLASPYAEALRACIDEAFRSYDVVSVVASGTIIRGTPDATSDLDVHILHRIPFRERVQVWHHGVPCEVFVNPPARIPIYFKEDAADRRPMTAHMFATGVIVYDPEGIAAELVAQAKASLLNPPPPDEAALTMARYHAATAFEDAEDLAVRDPEGASLLLCSAVKDLVLCRVAAEPGWLPRAKDLLPRLREIDPESADLAVKAVSSSRLTDRLFAGRKLCGRVTGAPGFFEWSSAREFLEPSPVQVPISDSDSV